MIDRFGVHRLDDRDVVDDLRRDAAAVRSPMRRDWPCCANLKIEWRDRERLLPRGHAGDPLAHRGCTPAVPCPALVRAAACSRTDPSARPAGLMEEDDSLRLRQGNAAARCCRSLPSEQRGQAPEPDGAAEELPARVRSVVHAHSFVIVSSRFRIALATRSRQRVRAVSGCVSDLAIRRPRAVSLRCQVWLRRCRAR